VRDGTMAGLEPPPTTYACRVRTINPQGPFIVHLNSCSVDPPCRIREGRSGELLSILDTSRAGLAIFAGAGASGVNPKGGP
jgi:hypothetical protein